MSKQGVYSINTHNKNLLLGKKVVHLRRVSMFIFRKGGLMCAFPEPIYSLKTSTLFHTQPMHFSFLILW